VEEQQGGHVRRQGATTLLRHQRLDLFRPKQPESWQSKLAGAVVWHGESKQQSSALGALTGSLEQGQPSRKHNYYGRKYTVGAQLPWPTLITFFAVLDLLSF